MKIMLLLTMKGGIPVGADLRAEIGEKMGKWMKVNGEAIYGTRPYPSDHSYDWGEVTRKGNTVYLFPLDADGKTIEVAVMGNKIEKAYVLGSGAPVEITQTEDIVTVTSVPENDSEMPQVIVLESNN